MEDNRKFIVLVLVALGVITGEILFRFAGFWVHDVFRLSTTYFLGDLSFDAVGRAGSYAVAAGLAILSYRSPAVFGFLNEVCNELRKVTWPEGKETLASSVVVVIVVMIVAAFLTLIDMVWGFLFRTFI